MCASLHYLSAISSLLLQHGIPRQGSMDARVAVALAFSSVFPCIGARLLCCCCWSPPWRLPAVGVRSPAAQLRSAPLQGCRAAQLLTDREMRGGDAGWGHKQGEAEEERQRERAQPLNTRQQHADRERERNRETGWFLGGAKGTFDAADMNWKETLEEAGIVFLNPEI